MPENARAHSSAPQSTFLFMYYSIPQRRFEFERDASCNRSVTAPQQHTDAEYRAECDSHVNRILTPGPHRRTTGEPHPFCCSYCVYREKRSISRGTGEIGRAHV